MDSRTADMYVGGWFGSDAASTANIMDGVSTIALKYMLFMFVVEYFASRNNTILITVDNAIIFVASMLQMVLLDNRYFVVESTGSSSLDL